VRTVCRPWPRSQLHHKQISLQFFSRSHLSTSHGHYYYGFICNFVTLKAEFRVKLGLQIHNAYYWYRILMCIFVEGQHGLVVNMLDAWFEHSGFDTHRDHLACYLGQVTLLWLPPPLNETYHKTKISFNTSVSYGRASKRSHTLGKCITSCVPSPKITKVGICSLYRVKCRRKFAYLFYI
jgi:hypothetical protein